jgi:hypothetical protein
MIVCDVIFVTLYIVTPQQDAKKKTNKDVDRSYVSCTATLKRFFVNLFLQEMYEF